MRKFVASFAVLALIVSPAVAGEKYNNKITIGEKAPAFSGIPAVMGDQDASLSLSDIKEDVVVLMFLANHSFESNAYEDRIVDLVGSIRLNVKFVGVCVTVAEGPKVVDDLEAIRERVKNRALTFVYGYDETQAIGRAYGAVRTPEFFVIDKNRTVRYAGAFDDCNQPELVKSTYVKDAVSALLAGKEVRKTSTKARGSVISYPNSK